MTRKYAHRLMHSVLAVGMTAYVLVVSLPAMAGALLADMVINTKRHGNRSVLLHSVVFAPIVCAAIGSCVSATISAVFALFLNAFPSSVPAFVGVFFPPVFISAVAGALAGAIAASVHLYADSFTQNGIYVPFGGKITVPENAQSPIISRPHVKIWSHRDPAGQPNDSEFSSIFKVTPSVAQRLGLHEVHLADMPPDSLRATLPLLVSGAIMLTGGFLPALQPILPFPVWPIMIALDAAVFAYIAWQVWRWYRLRRPGNPMDDPQET